MWRLWKCKKGFFVAREGRIRAVSDRNVELWGLLRRKSECIYPVKYLL